MDMRKDGGCMGYGVCVLRGEGREKEDPFDRMYSF